MERLLVVLEQVLYLMDRCKIYETLYLQDRTLKKSNEIAYNNLRKAVVLLYAEILNFFAKALGTYEKSSTLRFASALWNLEETAGLADSLRALESRADRKAQNCERVCSSDARRDARVGVSELKEMLKELEGSKSLVSNIDKRTADMWDHVLDDFRAEILYWISSVPYRDNHRLAKENMTENTGEWLIEDPVFQEWKLADSSQIFWLHGIRKAFIRG